MLAELFTDYTLRTVTLGSVLLGIISGTLGTYAVLRKQSLIGDMVSHAALPGIGLSFLIIGSKNTEWLLLGAFIAAWIATIMVNTIHRNSRIKYDSALGMTLAVFFGFGLVLLTYIQKIPNANQAGLENFLFGQASTLLERDIILMGIVALISIIIVILFWKEFKLLSFDPDFSDIIGFSTDKLDLLLTTLIVIAVIVGLQSVGVVLMSAMLIAPAVASRQWTDKLSIMIVLSSFFGGLSGIIGTLISSSIPKMPTGPIIVMVVTAIAFISILFAPRRGLIWKRIKDYYNKKELSTNMVLNNLYSLYKNHGEDFHPHDLDTICLHHTGTIHSKRILKRELHKLEISGLAREYDNGNWAITQRGLDKMGSIFFDDGGNIA
ncbi:MAG: metal ABC transporter permease [Tissierellia bacterium]|nr:metal ABC transporter permease [Tissierellia bacterium]